MQDPNFFIKYIIFFCGTLIFSLLINRIFLRFVKSLGIRNTTDTVIRWNPSSRPSIGGLTFYIVFLLSLSVYSIAFNNRGDIFNLREIGVLLSCTLGFLMGLADDAYDTRPILKSLTQIGCGLILVLTGTSIELFGHFIPDMLLTLVWVMGIMNAINMLDNMDGIAGSVSIVIAMTMLSCLTIMHHVNNLYFILITGLICSLGGFLYFNWYPSKLFMGDSGSQFLGTLLAALGIMFFWNLEPVEPAYANTSKQILVPLLAFIVPIVDTTTVVINRLSRGQSPFVGGKDHTTHNLARIGLRESKVALTVTIISLISAALILYNYDGNEILELGKAIGLTFYILIVFLLLFAATQYKKDIKS